MNAQSPAIDSELMREAFEHSPMGMVIVDTQGIIVLVNSALHKLLGYAPEELVGHPVERLLPEQLAAAHRGQRQSYNAHAKPRAMGQGRELTARHKTGRVIPVEVGLSPISCGGERFVLGTVVDITERRRLESELARAQNLLTLENVTSGVAHDFNNLLLGILGYAELARQDNKLHSNTRASLDNIVEITLRGRDFVQLMLSLARKEAPHRDTVHWEPILFSTQRLLRLALPVNTGIQITVGENVPPVRADPTELHQVLMNLVTNAIHATKNKGGTIRLEVAERPNEELGQTEQSHSWVRLSVIDEGEGMTPEVLSRVFDPFFTTKPPGEGTGLGMAVIQRVVQALGGVIQVDSREGYGTRVDVYLPVGDGSKVVTAGDNPTSAHRSCILYVDDEEHLAHLGRRALESAGFEVATFTSSVDALQEFRSNPDRFDLVISDNAMPGFTGSELIGLIAQIRPALPVIMVSGAAISSNAHDSSVLGVRRTLPKPFLISELRAAVQETLERRHGK